MAEDVTFTPAPDSGPAYRQLRSLLHAVAISMMILTGTMFIFIYREVVLIRRQTNEFLTGISEYERTNTQKLIEQLQVKLGEYARQHPDFVPLYARYFGTNGPSPAALGTPVKIPTNATPTPTAKTKGP
jgi:hypothetical protein